MGESDQVAVQMTPTNNQDCVGNPVPEGDRIANVFFVADTDTGVVTDRCGIGDQVCALFCRGYNETNQNWLGDAVALIDGVDQLQILYGVSNDSGQVNRYVDASRVADPSTSENQQLIAWDKVRSTKLAVLVSDGVNAGTERQESRPFQLLDASTITFDDRVSRKIYSTTVTINNKLP